MSTLGSKARAHDDAAIATLAEVMADDDGKPSDRIAAATALLDRGHGKPVSAVITLPADASAVSRLTSLSDEALLAAISAGRVGAALMAAGESGGGSTPKIAVPISPTVRDTGTRTFTETNLPPTATCHGQIADGAQGSTPLNGTFLPANANRSLKNSPRGLFSIPDSEELDELAT